MLTSQISVEQCLFFFIIIKLGKWYLILKVYIKDINDRVRWPNGHLKNNKCSVFEAEAIAQPCVF